MGHIIAAPAVLLLSDRAHICDCSRGNTLANGVLVITRVHDLRWCGRLL